MKQGAWAQAVSKVLSHYTPDGARWTDLDDIVGVLTPFMGAGNHVMLPGKGGVDFNAISSSVEADGLELRVSKREVSIVRPGALYFERFPKSPLNSFFLLETTSLNPCGVYDDVTGCPYEEVIDIGAGDYKARAFWDDGNLGEDEDGDEIPLPEDTRLVTRYLQPGKFLIVAKASFWFKRQASYDGRHNEMTAEEIRFEIRDMIAAARGRA